MQVDQEHALNGSAWLWPDDLLLDTSLLTQSLLSADLTGLKAFDPDWYLARYPDVAASGENPIVHYLQHGIRESRYGNQTAEMNALEDFDAAWYMSQYPDVAAQGIDPQKHFLEHGLSEGRKGVPDASAVMVASPDADLSASDGFDAAWYMSQYPDVAAQGIDPLRHYLEHGLREGRASCARTLSITPLARSRAEWADRFDAAWYLSRNPDVVELGIDPLTHFVTQGILENRRPNPKVELAHTPLSNAKLTCLKQPGTLSEVTLFVAHSPHGRLKPNVPDYLRHLKESGIAIILIVAADCAFEKLDADVEALLEGLFVRENLGYDFAAWAHVIGELPQIWTADIVYFMNDSVIGPVNRHAFAALIKEVRQSPSDMVGLTESVDRGWHLQSYFLVFKRRSLDSTAFRNFIANIVNFQRKDDVVNEYETRLAATLRSAGLKTTAVFVIPGASNPTLYHWRDLLRRGDPFVKLSTIRDDTPNVSIDDWREVIEAYGYDSSIADRCLADYWRWVSPQTAGGAEVDAGNESNSLAELHEFLASRATLTFPTSTTPAISLVVAVDGRPEAALRSLKALTEACGSLAVEVIVVDDASRRDTPIMLQRVSGALILRNAASLGFIGSVNRGANEARGPIIVLTDVTTCIEPGALDACTETLSRYPLTFVAGGPILRHDKTMLQGGVTVWNSGQGTCLSKRDDGAFRCDIDALSHHLVAVQRASFEDAGRLNPDFESADAALADLCLTMRRMGGRVVYEPRIASIARNEWTWTAWSESDAKALSRRHQFTLLKDHQSPDRQPAAPWNSQRRASLLIVAGFDDDSQIADQTRQIAHACVAAGFAVSLYPRRNTGRHARLDMANQGLLLDIEFIYDVSLDSVLSREPLRFDVILVDRGSSLAPLAQYFRDHVDALRGRRIVYNAASESRHRTSLPIIVEAEGSGSISPEVVDLTLVCSEAQKHDLVQLGFLNTSVIGRSDTERVLPAFQTRRDIVIVGSFRDDTSLDAAGLLWFADEVLPRLDERIGFDYLVHVFGATGSTALNHYRHPRVLVHGLNADLSVEFDSFRLLVCPWEAPHHPAVTEAMLQGLPAVIRHGKVQSLVMEFGQALSLAGNADEFAATCADLYMDELKWTERHQSGLEVWRRMAEHMPSFMAQRAVKAISRVAGIPVAEESPPPQLRAPSPERSGSEVQDDSEGWTAPRHRRDIVDATRVRVVRHGQAADLKGINGNVSAIYLARGADHESIVSIERFLESYSTRSAGIEHDLFVIIKGFDDAEKKNRVSDLVTRLGGAVLNLPDDGYDVGAYIRAARMIRSDYLFFMNTHSEILADDWLYLFACRFTRKEVGLVGATGSFEAHEVFAESRRFPNIHLRSNAFMIPCHLFMAITHDRTIVTKEDAYRFESGPQSITHQIMVRGLEVLVVGRNGRSYPPRWWPCSDTFRQNRQDNLVIADNQTRWYDSADESTRDMLFSRAWGKLVDMKDFMT